MTNHDTSACMMIEDLHLHIIDQPDGSHVFWNMDEDREANNEEVDAETLAILAFARDSGDW